MKVTKAQAMANRATVVDTASRLFRERGFDGVGVSDLMAAAGFTHGGFYKQFGSKTDLIAESTACGIARTVALANGLERADFVQRYLSRAHRDDRGAGCTVAALAGDAARQPGSVRATFARGIEHLVRELTPAGCTDVADVRARVLDTLAHAVGALVISRACPDDSALANEILVVCRNALLAGTARSEGGTPRDDAA